MQIDWLGKRYRSISHLERRRGMSLISQNYIELNRHCFPVNYRAGRTSQELDLSGNSIIFSYTLGDIDLLNPTAISIDKYFHQRTQLYRSKELANLCKKSFLEEPESGVRTEKIELIGADIAGQRVSLRVSGNVNINGRLQNQKRSQVRTGYREGQSTTFVIDQKQQLNIEGKIGDRISILVDQDSERDFDFENALKIIYTGDEDDIVQKVEAGNVALSLPGTRFVTFSGKNNGLFGLKALMKLGGLDITAVASVEKGKKEKLSVDGGAQQTSSSIKDYQYRQNLYFFLNYKYRQNFYKGFLKRKGVFGYNEDYVVSDLEVYRSTNQETAGNVYGKAYVDPNDPNSADSTYTDQRVFERLELNRDYQADLNLGYIRLATQIQDNEILAVSYRIVDSDGNTVVSYGSWDRALDDTTDVSLKLIKPRSMTPSHPCWDLEFKNVYSLGSTDINEEGFELSIVYIHGKNGEIDRDPEDGVSFLQKFGLDLKDQSGNLNPDDIVDLDNKAIVNLTLGELWLPFLRPFHYEQGDQTGEHNPYISENYSCTAMYDSNRTRLSDITEDSKFKIVYKYENRSSKIELGPMVIEGSESVTMDGTVLTKGVDYSIDYFTGTLTLLSQEALDPNANLDIKYERNQFFQLDKKTILGARAQYDFGENSYIGGTALYFSKSVVDEKVEVGYEPMRNFVWDLNGRFNKNLNFLTQAIDWLPLIETDTPSKFTFEGEIAQVLPNPNTISNEDTGDPNGVGFIDDFEGAKRITSPPIMRQYWSRSAAPLGKKEDKRDLRGFLFWFNPFGGIATKNIWPNKEVSTRAQNNITEVLILTLDPMWSIAVADTVAKPEEAWGGITYSFPTSYYDQSKTKFLEIWVRGNSGNLHIDLGQISEDQIANEVLDTEDQASGGFTLGNDLLDEGEDTGIDGVFDEDEFIVTSFGDTLFYGNDTLEKYGRDPKDPHSDNWYWREGSPDYRWINGTENSEKDANGYIPNTEDLNRNYAIDLVNDYYTIDLSLNDRIDDKYVAGRTQYESGKRTGWKLYRIPLSEFRRASPQGNVSWQQIESCRIWMDGAARQDSVWIAKIELVGNEWEEVGVSADEGQSYRIIEDAFSISVINTEDNPDTYKAPKGVQGEYDRINEIRMKEQSLVLWFDGSRGLRPGEKAAAKKQLPEQSSFITYKKMKMYINGHNLHTRTHNFTKDDEPQVQLFLKFGRGGDNPQFYEYRTPVYPGWEKRNNIEIDLDFVTSLKAYSNETDFPENNEYPKQFRIIRNEEGEIIRRHYREVKDGKYTGREILIHGEPSITRILQLEVGVLNRRYALDDYDDASPLPRYDNTVYGEIWIDELRLSEVRRDAGLAYRSQMSLELADLASFSVNLDRRDADFHTVEQRPALNTNSLNTTQNMSLRGRVSLDKFTPVSWGLRLPVSGSYSEKRGTPKYLPNTDILTGESPPDSILQKNQSYGVSTSFSKRSSDYWLTKYTVDQLNLGFNAQWSQSSSVNDKLRSSEMYRGNVSYRVPFGKNNYLEIFKWLSGVPLLGERLGDTHWYYTPNSFEVSLDASESKSTRISRFKQSEQKDAYDFGLNRSIRLGYKVFDNLNLNYNRKMKNSLVDLRNDKLRILKELNPGQPVNVNESYSASFSPKIFKWLTPNINYSSNYNWNEPPGSGTKSIDQLSNQSRISSSFSLNPADILRSVYTPKSSKQSGRGRGTTGRTGRSSGYTPGQPSSGTTEKGEEKQKESREIKALEYLYQLLGKFQAIQISYSYGRNSRNMGRIGTPDLLYRMGFQEDPGLEILRDEVGSTNVDNITRNSDISLRSGLKILSNVNTSLSFSQNMAWGEASGQRTYNMTRDFLILDPKKREGFPFPGWTVNVSQLEKISLLSKFFKKLSLDHGFSGKEVLVYRNGVEQNASYKMYFQPLAGLSMQFKNDMNANLRSSYGQTVSNQSGGTRLVNEIGVNGSLNYQKRGGFTIPLPFMEDKRLDNTMNFTMSFNYNSSITRERNTEGKDFTTTQENRSWKIEPRISYSFTQKVTGAIFYSYGESFNARTGKRITRNGGFDINIAIRG